MPLPSTLSSSLTVQRQVLSNGIVVLTTENYAADIIAARIFLRVGGRYETPQQAGIAHLLTSVLTKGTERLSSMEIAERVESVGASLSTDASPDYCLLSLKTVSQDFAEMLALGAELLRSPSFPESEIELERRLTIQGIRSSQEQPFAIAQKQLRQAMYGNHPYAMSSLGTEETVAQLSRDDLVQFHRTYFRPDNVVISVTGHISPEDAIALVEETFGDWLAPAELLPILKLPPITTTPQTLKQAQETQQAIVMLGYLTPAVQHADYMPLKLLATYLGSGLSSRLFVELREKQGLAYEVSAFYPTRLDPAQFVAYMGTAPGNVAIALNGLRYELDRLATHRLSEDELQAAKNKLLGQYALGKQTNAQIAQIYGWYETLGLGIDFDQRFQQEISAVTAETAQIVAQRYFGDPFVSMVGPAEAIGKSV
ncbi:MAG TPA: insulinase family protein [Synechococcales cyanobacterium M55_K2018_004]|nr:insulinase family protein [Synechococcales cyanobacterium M55_K2018_004]